MTISTYPGLLTAITEWSLGRSDLATNSPDIVALAEGYFNQVLRCREMEAVTTLSPETNVCTLPDDYLEYKRVVEMVSPRRRLDYITEDAADELYPFRDAGTPSHFMIVGSGLTALPLSSNDIELTYYQAVPSLSASNVSNWLLARSPNLYLHTCLMYVAELMKWNDELTKEQAFVKAYVDALQGLDVRSKFGNAGVTLRGPVF